MRQVKQIVNAKDVYKSGLTGKGIRIALLDSGVFEHIDLQNRIVYFKDYINQKEFPYDDNGHGTHIAGIMAGNGHANDEKIMGMAPKAELLVFKILDEKGNGKTFDALKALDWILEHHKQYHIRILNFSMGYKPNANEKMQNLLLEKLSRLWEEGVVVVTAAGNNGPKDATITVPGILREVITVGACENASVYQTTVADYSGRGPTNCCIVKPEILAPGTEIVSLSNYKNGYEKKSGTSMSAPIVSGTLALALEKKPQLSPEEIKILLYDSVTRQKGAKKSFWGILNVDKLMKML